MIEVKYKGKEISEDVAIITCYHDMYAGERLDTLHIKFDDSEHVWDSWGVKTNDEIAVEYGAIKTGTMYVYKAVPSNGLFEIIAASAPTSHKDRKSKAWQKIKLKAMCKEIAGNHNLGFESYGAPDVLYDRLLQDNESDFSFLNKQCILEGCAVLVYDKKLILYSEKHMEGKTADETIYLGEDSDYEYIDQSGSLYGSCKIKQGDYTGKFEISNGSSKKYVPDINIAISSKAEATRYAKNLLRYVNKNAHSGYLYNSILTGYAPASMATLENERAPSWDGDVFLTHIRNDYAKGKCKIFFRRPLKGDY